MDTPICDFVNRYVQSGAMRAHMPGHKGKSFLGMEPLDITEFAGADSLYEASGIIRQSEENASSLFGSETFYSTEGCSQCIRAMLYLAVLYAKEQGRRPLIAAARNVHKTFLSAAALLDFDVRWLYPKQQDAYLSCRLTASDLEETLQTQQPAAVYVTSPDYLGNCLDIRSLAEICHKHGALLLVDNAHGAYLRFLHPSRHPMDLGADLCCDSAHKTLPVLTGGAYLHVGRNTSPLFSQQAKNALMLFGSTSPSYLILQSLDAANRYLADGYREALAAFMQKMDQLKDSLTGYGYCLQGDEPLKLTISAKPYGYTGDGLAQALLAQNIYCEFSDPDFTVMMLTPETTDLDRLEQALLAIPRRTPIIQPPPAFHRCAPVMSIRQAALSPCETIPVADSIGRILAAESVGCPPAVPIVICGERIDAAAIQRFSYYAMESCTVVKGEHI